LELKSTKLFSPLAFKNAELQTIWQNSSRVKRFISNDPAITAKEGARSRKFGLVPEMCIVEKLDNRTRFKFLAIKSENNRKIVNFQSIGNIEYRIPEENTYPYVRDASNNKMNLEGLNEFIIWKIENDNYFEEIDPDIIKIYHLVKEYDSTYRNKNLINLDSLKNSNESTRRNLRRLLPQWTEKLIDIVGEKNLIKDTKKIISNSFNAYQNAWNNYLFEKLCYLGAIETFHIEAPNTYFFAYYSGNSKRVFSSIFNNIVSLSEDEAKINCLWLNSSINFLQLFCEQIPIGWFKIRQYVLESLKIIDINKLDSREKETLLNLFEEISIIEFPCIWQQILSNVNISVLDNCEKEAIVGTFGLTEENFKELVKNPFEPRKRLDLEIMKILFPRKTLKGINETLEILYHYLICEIVIAKQLVSN